MRGVVLLLAAGSGERLGSDVPKAFVDLGGISILRRSADSACAADLVDRLVVAAPPGGEEQAEELLDGIGKPFIVVAGASTRQGSAAIALAAVTGSEAVVVHDAARALCPTRLFDQCLRALDDVEAVCVVVPVGDTIKDVSRDVIVSTHDRSSLAAAQTPQAFRTDVYRRAHDAASRDDFVGTDDAGLVERIGVQVRVIPGEPNNLKITTELELVMAEALLARGGVG